MLGLGTMALAADSTFLAHLSSEDEVPPNESLAGHPLSDLVAEIAAGNAYVNVHTSDGDATTPPGPGDLPGGEIRGKMD